MTSLPALPLIQGGMGVAVSSWQLVRAVAQPGHLGVVSVTAIERVVATSFRPDGLPAPGVYRPVPLLLIGAGIPQPSRSLSTVVCCTDFFTPADFGVPATTLRRPRFIAIISSDVLAQSLARSGGVDGFVVEGPRAGGHNAPPRVGGTLNEDGEPVYGPRNQADLPRMRALGYLRHAYAKPDGAIGWRCGAEPQQHYQAKGGNADDCTARRCICNGLMAAAGHAQATGQSNDVELPLLTAGDDLMHLGRFLHGKTDYTASDVIDELMSGMTESAM